MDDQSYTWDLDNFSSLQHVNKTYSSPFFLGSYWRLIAYPKRHMNGGYLGLYLEVAYPTTLQPFWRREVKFSLTLVNKALGRPNIVLGGQCFFDTKEHNHHREFVSLTKLHDKNEGFLVDDKLVIVADILVFPAPVAPLVSPALVASERSVKFGAQFLSINEGNQASHASKWSSFGEMVQKTMNASKDDDTSYEESSDDDDDTTTEESSYDDDSSSVSSENSVKGYYPNHQKIRKNYMNELVIFLNKVIDLPEKFAEDGNTLANSRANATLIDMIHHSFKLNSVTKLMNEFSNSDGVMTEPTSTASLLIKICKWHLTKRTLDVSENFEKDGAEPNNLVKEASPVKETVGVNGFQVCIT